MLLTNLALILVGTAISVLARSAVPLSISASPFDGGLFVRQASYLIHGQWLGPFDDLTLVKGPAYPMLIALTHTVGMPLKVAEQLTWLLAAGCTALCVWMVTRRRSLSTIGYLVMAFSADSFGVVNSVDLRDGWYASLSLLFVSSLFLALYGALRRVRAVWTILAGSLAGVSGAAFWMCREEGPWILPAVVTIAFGLPLAAALAVFKFRPSGSRPSRRQVSRRLSRYGLAGAIVFALFAGPIAFVKVENDDHYRISLINDQTTGAFARAYADWERVSVGPPVPQFPITTAQRQAVYRVSPAARQLEHTLEDPKNGWRQLSCRFPQSQARGCDLLGALMVWAIRSAAADAGHFDSAPHAQRFFTELSTQIDAGCDQHRLRCRARLPAALQPVLQVPVGSATQTFVKSAWNSVWSPSYTALVTSPSGGPQSTRDAAHAVITAIPATQAAAARQVQQFTSHEWPFRALADGYRLLLPCLLVLGLAGMVLGFARSSWPHVALPILCAAFAIGALSRLAVLTVVVITQFDASGGRYELPTRALLLGFGVAGTAILVDQLWPRRPSSVQPVASDAPRDSVISVRS